MQAGYIDYEAMADEFVTNFRELGIDIKANKAQPDSVDQQKKSGDFQLMINYMGAGCDYANGMGATLTTAQFPTKTEIKGNVGRFSDPAVDAAVKELTGTTDPAQDQGAGRGAGQRDDDPVPGAADPLRPGPQHLPHRQGGRLAERGGPVRQPAGQRA